MRKPGESIVVEENVCDIFDGIVKEEILLPDFQRGFVWDEEKIKPFIASVLTKLPVGSLLMLESKATDYACRRIGRTERVSMEKKSSDEPIFALLDGQQRITVLTHTFSDFMIDKSVKYSDLISPKTLYRRQFLRIPSYMQREDYEIYGLDTLIFPFSATKDFPNFTSDQIEKSICSVKISANEVLHDVANQDINRVMEFCKGYEEGGKKYSIIPLYYLYKACKDEKSRAYKILRQILNGIATEYLEGIMNDFLSKEEESEKEFFVTEVLKVIEDEVENPADGTSCYKYLDEAKSISEMWLRLILSERRQQWVLNMIEYLKSCIEKMNINIMYVDHANRARAIEIYENINKGGKSLNIFDLILARAALKENEKSFLTTIIDYISENHYEDYKENKIPDQIKVSYDNYLKKNNYIYSASERMGCKNNQNDLTAYYCEIYLQVLALICHDKYLEKRQCNYKEITSRKRILQLESEEINDNNITVCRGIDRACFFFQTRCGIRMLTDVSYKLVVVLIAYVLSNDDLYREEKIHNWLEAWYWTVLFSGEFNTDPSGKFQRWLNAFITMFGELRENKENIETLVSFRKQVFKDEKFSSEKFLLLKKQDMDPPKGVVRKFICQFYMAKTYKDFLLHNRVDEEGKKVPYEITINAFMEEEKLNEHHIVPIGGLHSKLRDINQSKERKNLMNIYNSPLNFILITAETNNILLNNPISYYQNYCLKGCFSSAGIKPPNNQEFQYVEDSDDELRAILKGRFNELEHDVNERLDILGIRQ